MKQTAEEREQEKQAAAAQFEDVKTRILVAVRDALTPIGFQVYTSPTVMPPRFMNESLKPSTLVMTPTEMEFVPVYISTGMLLSDALKLPLPEKE